jgi:hypothetical protein
VTLIVETRLAGYSFECLEYLTSHIEILVLDSIEDQALRCLRDDATFPEMELPGLKQINVIGDDLPQGYILECFSAICNSKLPRISLHMKQGEALNLVKLVRHPIFRIIHTIDIATGEAANHSVLKTT